MMTKKNQKIQKTKTPLSTGGTKNSRFAALCDSDDDSAPAVEAPQEDPIVVAMCRGDILWGDLLIQAADTQEASIDLLPTRPVHEEEDFWAQPWAGAVECRWSNCYDTSGMSDAAWEAMMTWLYSVGWEVAIETRRSVQAFPDNQPARVWVAPNRFELMAQMDSHPCCNHKPTVQLSAPGSDKGKRKGAPVPRFCRAGTSCQEAGCRYIHGDTIPRLNQPCSFGEACGSSDPTGVKRSQCLHMHPGETWAEGMVIHRPVAPAN